MLVETVHWWPAPIGVGGLPFSYTPNPREWIIFSVNLTPCCRVSLPYIMGFDININHQRIQTTRSHASRCHHCNHCHYYNVDFVLFHNVTCYIDSLFSRFHVNTTKLPNITCTLVATSMILRGLECTPFIVSRTLFAKGLNYMPRGLKVSHPLLANMILFFNSSNFLSEKYLHCDI